MHDAAGPHEPSPPLARPPLPTPSFASVDRRAGRLQLRLRFLGWADLVGVCCFLLLAGLVGMNIFAPGGRGLGPRSGAELAVIFVVGCYGAVRLLNTRRVEVTRHRLTVRMGPLPWPGRLDLRVADVVALRCATRVHEDSEHADTYTYEVHAVLKSRREVPVLKGLNTMEHARWVARELERFLGIEVLESDDSANLEP